MEVVKKPKTKPTRADIQQPIPSTPVAVQSSLEKVMLEVLLSNKADRDERLREERARSRERKEERRLKDEYRERRDKEEREERRREKEQEREERRRDEDQRTREKENTVNAKMELLYDLLLRKNNS